MPAIKPEAYRAEDGKLYKFKIGECVVTDRGTGFVEQQSALYLAGGWVNVRLDGHDDRPTYLVSADNVLSIEN